MPSTTQQAIDTIEDGISAVSSHVSLDDVTDLAGAAVSNASVGRRFGAKTITVAARGAAKHPKKTFLGVTVLVGLIAAMVYFMSNSSDDGEYPPTDN